MLVYIFVKFYDLILVSAVCPNYLYTSRLNHKRWNFYSCIPNFHTQTPKPNILVTTVKMN